MALTTFFLVLVSSYVICADLIKECPPGEMSSCVCRKASLGINVICRHTDSLQMLQGSVQAFRGYLVERLTLVEVNAPALPADLFQGLHVKELHLDKFEVEDSSFRPGQPHFVGLENSLEQLLLFFSFKDKKPFSNLKLDHLRSLKKIHFSGSRVLEIGNDWFTNGPKSLTTVYLFNNELEKLGDKAFASLANLQSLTIEYNLLKKITRSMLPLPANHLRTLDLSRNKLRTLPDDIFSGMPSLQAVRLDKNLIQSLPEVTWSSVLPRLRYLDFRGNPLQCDQGLKWVCSYNTHNIYAECASPAEKKGRTVYEFCTS